jgi:biopolymer transport protein ExbB
MTRAARALRSSGVGCATLVALSLTLAGVSVAQTEAEVQDKAAADQVAPPVKAPPKAVSLDQLLQQIRKGWNAENKENQRREAAFRVAKQDQQKLLAQAKAALNREEKLSEQYERQFEENELRIAELEDLLSQRLGNLGELFGVVRQVAGDTRSHIDASLISAQLPDRAPFLTELGKSKSLPSLEALEKLWYMLHQEMTEQGKVARFRTPIVSSTGDLIERDVVRVGPFTAVGGGKYLQWKDDAQKLIELGREPAARYQSTVADLEEATEGVVRFAVDPARGSILGMLVQTPNFEEQIQAGGPIGYAIIVLGSTTFLMALLRMIYIFLVSRAVDSQVKNDQPSEKNPLGRVLLVYEENKESDTETLELKLDEAILRETARAERFSWLIKVVAAVAPLMGLLGTVTGMIKTFQMITLFGAGDPKYMASGISEALVTTMLGLCVAIPLVLLHSIVSSMSKRVVDVLEEQSAGLVATRSEGSPEVAAK